MLPAVAPLKVGPVLRDKLPPLPSVIESFIFKSEIVTLPVLVMLIT